MQLLRTTYQYHEPNTHTPPFQERVCPQFLSPHHGRVRTSSSLSMLGHSRAYTHIYPLSPIPAHLAPSMSLNPGESMSRKDKIKNLTKVCRISHSAWVPSLAYSPNQFYGPQQTTGLPCASVCSLEK